MVEKTKAQQFASKVVDLLDQKIEEHGGKYIVRFDDVEQMNEIAAYLGLPQCDHGRAYVASILRNPNDDPDATEVGFGKKAVTVN